MSAPNIPKPDRAPTMTETVNARFLKRLSGTIGSFSKCSTMTKVTSSAKPPTRGTRVCQEPQP